MPGKLFMTSTREEAERLRHAPGIMVGAPTGAVEVALPAHEDQERPSGGEETPHSGDRAEDD